MRVTRIITAKIEPEIFRKIVDGSKRFEVRDESFHSVPFIHYVSAGGDLDLEPSPGSFFRLGDQIELLGSQRDFAQALSGVDTKTFDRLFPASTNRFYVAPIGERLTFNDIFSGEGEQ